VVFERTLRGSGAFDADSPPPDVEAPPPASATLSLVAGLEALARTKTCGDAPPTPRHHRLAGTRCAGGRHPRRLRRAGAAAAATAGSTKAAAADIYPTCLVTCQRVSKGMISSGRSFTKWWFFPCWSP